MSTRDSGYGESWNRNRARAQPNPTNILFSPQDMNKQSQPLQADQFFSQVHSYREPGGTSVSGIESLPPDYFTQTPLDEVHEQDFDLNPPQSSDDLAGLDLEGNLFTMELEPAYSPTPNIPRYPELPQSGSELFPMFNNEVPWSEYRNRSPSDNIMPTQPQQAYDVTSTGKRRRIESDSGISGIGTQRSSPSSAFNPPRTHVRSRPTLNKAYLQPSTPAPAQQDDITSPYPHEQQQRTGSVSARRHTSPSPSQQSAQPSATKASRKSSERYFCDQCQSTNFAGFSTSNDLARHRRGVHGIFEPGDKIWRCRMEGCNCADKNWPRRDNFQSHLKRMHFNNDENKAREAVDKFQEFYDSSIHGSPDTIKTAARGGHRPRPNQDLPSSTHAQKRASVPNTSMTQQSFMVDTSGQGRGIFNQYVGGMVPNISGSLTSSAMNHGHRATTAMSTVDEPVTAAASPQFFQSPHMEAMGRSMVRPYARTAPPNPDSTLRRKREMQEQDQAVQHEPRNGPSVVEDLTSIGIGLGHSDTVDPSLLFTAGTGDRTIDLNATGSGSRPDSDPEKALEDMLRRLSPKSRARLFNRVEQGQRSDQGQGFSERSVPKPTTKKKADGEKTLKCFQLVEKKGEKERTLVKCPASFNSQSELRKHRKRHDKRFGCTFDNCYSKFGTKWEWKRHEQSQHIQNEAWRCRYVNGEISCQKLFSDQKDFEKHLTKHFDMSNTEVIREEIEKCHLTKKWLGSFWCGYCRCIVRSQKEFGREMDDERVEHIGSHVLQGSKSSDWVELAADGKTKGEMKEIEEGGSRPESRSPQVESRKQPSHHEMEDQEEDDDESSDSDDSGSADFDESSSTVEAQQSRPKPPTLGVVTAQNSSVPPSSQGSHTGALPNTPVIQVHTPEGLIMADNMLDNVSTRPVQQQRAYTDSNTAGYRNQQQHQHLQAQAQPHTQPQPQQSHNLSRCCCNCRRPPWGIYQDKCDYPDCQHEWCYNCTFSSSQSNFVPGGFSNDDSEFGFYGINMQ